LNTGKAEAIKAGQQDYSWRGRIRARTHSQSRRGAPRVIVSSQPTALVLVDGQPGYQRVEGTQLSRWSTATRDVPQRGRRTPLLAGRGWLVSRELDRRSVSPVPEGELPAEIGPALEISRAAR